MKTESKDKGTYLNRRALSSTKLFLGLQVKHMQIAIKKVKINQTYASNNNHQLQLEYGADSDDEACLVKPGEPNCGSQWWWAKFKGTSISLMNNSNLQIYCSNLPVLLMVRNLHLPALLQSALFMIRKKSTEDICF